MSNFYISGMEGLEKCSKSDLVFCTVINGESIFVVVMLGYNFFVMVENGFVRV